MSKKTKSARSEKQRAMQAAVDEVQGVREVLALHQPVIDAAARAAVSCVLMLRQSLSVRRTTCDVLARLAGNVAKTTEALARGLFVASPDQLDFTESILAQALADTRALRLDLEVVTSAVRNLSQSYEVAKAGSPAAAFRALRDVSGGMLRDASEERRSAWRLVLAIWGQHSPEGPKIASWQPGLDDEKFKFKFDEASRTWRCVVPSDPSPAVRVETARSEAK